MSIAVMLLLHFSANLWAWTFPYYRIDSIANEKSVLS